jgi:hypothetical protein
VATAKRRTVVTATAVVAVLLGTAFTMTTLLHDAAVSS